MRITNTGRLIPITISELHQAINIKISPLFSNVQYTLQYLEVLDYQIKNIHTTDTVVKIFYKNYLINALSVIESIFLHILKENNAMPKENYIELIKFPTNERKVNSSFIKAETTLYKKVPEYEKKNIDFETMINRINEKKLMSFSKRKYLTIKNLKFLRNKVHLFIADSFNKSDFNSFSYKEYVWSKYSLYSIITDKSICTNEEILVNFKPTQEEMQFLINNPLIVEK